ncbi:MAG: SLBB domain-containing protein [Chloroflexi bacterium]|nr:SLBB domain-containing protein [Chloroflexota bacterium]
MQKLYQGVLWALTGAAIAGGVFILLQRPQQADITIILPTATATGPIQVYVTGAVAQPDLYILPWGSRIQDLLSAAGGPLPEADLAQVNLARFLRDG